MSRRRAFTLVELITVIAVSSILLTIIVIPLIQSFNLTRAAQAFSDAQERARRLINQISSEIGNAVSVRDTSGAGGQVLVFVPSDPNNDRNIDGYVPLTLDYAKLDVLAPSAGDPELGASGGLRNPDLFDEALFQSDFPGLTPGTDPYVLELDRQKNNPRYWKEDPTVRAPRGQVALPAAEGLKLVRYFVSLNRPLALTVNGDGLNPANVAVGQQDALIERAAYNNPYDGLFGRQNGRADNLFVLRRAEIELRSWDSVNARWAVNPLLDLNGNGRLEQSELDDPAFFLPNGTLPQARRVRAWMERSTIISEISRYDLIQAIFDKNTRRVVYDVATPRIISLIQFTPSRIASEPAEGNVAVRTGEETDNGEKLGPDVFTTDFGGYSNLFVRIWPSSYRVPNSNNIAPPWTKFQPWQSGRDYSTIRQRRIAGQPVGLSQFILASGGNEELDGTEVFDIDAYFGAKNFRQGDPLPDVNPPLSVPEQNLIRYPFSLAVARAENRSNWLTNPLLRENFIPMVPDQKAGKMVASFSITEVGTGTVNYLVDQDNRPRVSNGADNLPTNDPTLTGTPSATRWQQANYHPNSNTSTINQRFNVLYNDWDLILPTVNGGPSLDAAKYCDRFIDLRFVPTDDGAPSPLHPTLGFARARIVPGSEVIIGPDQGKGANRGNPVRYTRTTDAENVGPNEYFIQYVNQREPSYTELGFAGLPANLLDPTFYDPANFVSSVLQSRYRAGYVKFNSAASQPLPTGNMLINYRFQFTEPNDVIAIDYDSRQKMNVTLTVRNYAQAFSVSQQNVTVRGEATVRNFLR